MVLKLPSLTPEELPAKAMAPYVIDMFAHSSRPDIVMTLGNKV